MYKAKTARTHRFGRVLCAVPTDSRHNPAIYQSSPGQPHAQAAEMRQGRSFLARPGSATQLIAITCTVSGLLASFTRLHLNVMSFARGRNRGARMAKLSADGTCDRARAFSCRGKTEPRHHTPVPSSAVCVVAWQAKWRWRAGLVCVDKAWRTWAAFFEEGTPWPHRSNRIRLRSPVIGRGR